MATVQDPSKPVNRYERIVQSELSRAVLRVRLVDLGQAALGLLVAFLVYALVMILADRWLDLSPMVRQAGLIGFIGFAAVYSWFVLLRPIRRAINPYYAAYRVEQTIPDAKNSLVNWLDHRDDRLPAGVAAAIGKRAAEDLEEADVSSAFRSSLLTWLAGITLGLVAALLACMMVMRTEQFTSLLNRAFSPFNSGAIVKRTRIQLLTPPEGNATILINRAVTVAVQVEGRVPQPGRSDSLTLLVRYNPDDPNYDRYELQSVERGSNEWAFRLAPHQVRTGFYYKVVGGDDETPEYRISTRSSPHIDRFEVLRSYRPYVRFDPRRTVDPNIEDYRGTEITLDAITNRNVREGKLLLESEGKTATLDAERLPDRPETLRFRFKLDRDARYRIWFTTTDEESNNDPLPYTIRVLQDRVPQVEFTKPEELTRPGAESDLACPADDVLNLEGVARDDFGIAR